MKNDELVKGIEAIIKSCQITNEYSNKEIRLIDVNKLVQQIVDRLEINEVRLGNFINEFTWEHRKGKEGRFTISHSEGFELAHAISTSADVIKIKGINQ